MPEQSKKIVPIIVIGLLITIPLIFLTDNLPFIDFTHWKLYDILVKIDYKLRPPPSTIKDIVLVTIDNDTLKNMPQRWPYPRSVFAKVIENLMLAQTKVIAFDFVFFGESTTREDEPLKTALRDNSKIILASAIAEDGSLNLFSLPGLSKDIPSGIITKLQDRDGITRRNLTYLVEEKELHKGFLSWEMQILKAVKSIDLSSLASNNKIISFQNDKGQNWTIPVDPETKSFLINFRAHTIDFNRISFYRVFKGDFYPDLIKNKIVLVGMVSSLFADLHNTSLGWLPGITLNANAFLTLYTHNFLKNVPRYIEVFILMCAVFLSGLLISLLKIKIALFLITGEIFFFFILSYLALAQGYIWNYSLLPLAVSLSSFLSKNLLTIFCHRKRGL